MGCGARPEHFAPWVNAPSLYDDTETQLHALLALPNGHRRRIVVAGLRSGAVQHYVETIDSEEVHGAACTVVRCVMCDMHDACMMML